MPSPQAQRPIPQHAGTSADRAPRQRTTTQQPTTSNGSGGTNHCADRHGCSSSCHGGCSGAARKYSANNCGGCHQVGSSATTTVISTISLSNSTAVAHAATNATTSTAVASSSAAAAKPAATANVEPHIEITVDDDQNGDKDVENGGKKVRHRHRRRPLYRRVFNYLRQAWTGVTFSSSTDSELEELETTPRYRPDSLSALCRTTRFTEAEIKRIYRGFKAECPTGVVKEDTFKVIYSQFFPQGGLYPVANTGLYAHYVFKTLDSDRSGIVSFEEFVQGLSVLSRGSLDEKLNWTFTLYDINGDGYVTRDEMTDIVTSIFELMGRNPETNLLDMDLIKAKVDSIFSKMDVNGDGVVTLEEFIDCCKNDEVISKSISVFDMSI